jgi:hypothetical protein
MPPSSHQIPDREYLASKVRDRGRLFNRRDFLKKLIMGFAASCLANAFFFFIQMKAIISFILAEFLFFTRSH